MYIILCCSQVVYWKEFLGLWTAPLDPFPKQESLGPEEGGFRFLPKNKTIYSVITTYKISQ
jgi:hypothetical protein